MPQSEPQQTNRVAEMAEEAIRYFQDDAQHGGRIILREELKRKFMEVAEAAAEDAREPSIYREAIEATARELKVDPAALAEAARDGKLFETACELAERSIAFIAVWAVHYRGLHDLPDLHPDHQKYLDEATAFRDKVADLRAGKGGE